MSSLNGTVSPIASHRESAPPKLRSPCPIYVHFPSRESIPPQRQYGCFMCYTSSTHKAEHHPLYRTRINNHINISHSSWDAEANARDREIADIATVYHDPSGTALQVAQACTSAVSAGTTCNLIYHLPRLGVTHGYTVSNCVQN